MGRMTDYVLHALGDVSQPRAQWTAQASLSSRSFSLWIFLLFTERRVKRFSHCLPAIMQLWPIMLSARMPGLKESFCSFPLSCAWGWAPKSHEEAAAAQSHQCCAGKLSIAAGHQTLLWRGVHLASAWIPCSLEQICAAWFDLFVLKNWPTGAFDQGEFLVGRWFSPDIRGSLGDIQIFYSENFLQLRATSPATLFSHCAPAQRQWGCQSWRRATLSALLLCAWEWEEEGAMETASIPGLDVGAANWPTRYSQSALSSWIRVLGSHTATNTRQPCVIV